jgi:ATP-dependent protease ClpP protease subunit
MASSKNTPDYRKVVADGDTIFVYASIGEGWSWADGQEQSVGVTDTDFINALATAAKAHAIVKVRINSYGGSTKHGSAIMAAIQNCPAEVHTFNDGTAASMASGIWSMGTRRYMAKNAILMIHNPTAYAEGNARDLREVAEQLDKTAEAMAMGYAQNTGKTVEEIQQRFFADYKDHFLTYNDVKAEGLLSDGEEYDAGVPAPATEVVANMARAPFQQYQTLRTHEASLTAFQRMVAAFSNIFSTKQDVPPPAQTVHNVKKAELTAALAAGEITPEDLAELGYKAIDPPPPSQDLAALQSNYADMQAMLSDLAQKVKALGALPGAGRSHPGTPHTDGTIDPAKPSELDTFNAQMLAAANEGYVRFVPSPTGNNQ